jgi:hypothetical protein
LNPSIDMPFGLEDIEKVFAVAELVEDPDFITAISPEVKKFILKEGFLTSPHMRRHYLAMWDEAVTRQIKKQLIAHLNLTPEEVLLVCDPSFLKMIAPALYEKENYGQN